MWLNAVRKIINVSQWPLSVVIGLPVLAFIYIHAESHILYHRISLGMSEFELVDKFGPGDRQEPTMLFCERIFHWTGECPDNPLNSYRFYRTGIDRWVVVGFDQHGAAAFKSIGKL